jgi:rhodanese-related sulfurtransferase
MKQFLSNLAGGVAIIAAAVTIGVVHNAVRGQSIPLVQHVQPVATAGNGGDDPAGGEAADTAGGGAADSAAGTAADSTSGSLPEGAVSLAQVRAMVDTGIGYILDARGPEAFEEGHIPGAINVPYDRLAEHYQDLTARVPLGAKVVCYCWSPTCDFSDQLATELRIMGYTNVKVFTGGWEHWQDSGLPEETGEPGN